MPSLPRLSHTQLTTQCGYNSTVRSAIHLALQVSLTMSSSPTDILRALNRTRAAFPLIIGHFTLHWWGSIYKEWSGEEWTRAAGGIEIAAGPALGAVCPGEENQKLGGRRKGSPRKRETRKQMSKQYHTASQLKAYLDSAREVVQILKS